VKRHTITEGATTTAGGKVTGASSHGSINGARIALENDPVDCPACHSKGRIVCAGARLNERWNGIQVALENDLCVCQCYPHPRMVPSQTVRYQSVADGAASAQVAGSSETRSKPAAEAAAAEQQGAYDQHFQVNDEAGQPLADFPYVIELSNGRRIEGRTDRDGKTAKVEASGAEHATLIVYAHETLPLNPTWDR
jgi:uncharacterized Zn-binding protein involved in type VI secretion